MKLRKKIKYWLHGSCPGIAGRVRYYGVDVHFPRGSQIFRVLCEQGIYEYDNLRILTSAVRPNATALDIGANIGLLSIPLLAAEPTLTVLSVEPSPNTHAFLARTIAGSAHRQRWSAASVAVGDHEGSVDFFCAEPSLGVYDGLEDTHRAGATQKVKVPLTTVDRLWRERGCPDVCVIKIDVEGAEAMALNGALECLRATRPVVLVEWSRENLRAFGISPDRLLSLAEAIGYSVHAVPSLARVESPAQLKALMGFGESFALFPK